MVRLKNIERNNNIIECDIIPEDSVEYGHVTVNVISGDIESYRLPEGYENRINHVSFAKRALLEMADDLEFPKEKLVMWY